MNTSLNNSTEPHVVLDYLHLNNISKNTVLCEGKSLLCLSFPDNQLLCRSMISQCMTNKTSFFQTINYCNDLSKVKQNKKEDVLFVFRSILAWYQHNNG